MVTKNLLGLGLDEGRISKAAFSRVNGQTKISVRILGTTASSILRMRLRFLPRPCVSVLVEVG